MAFMRVRTWWMLLLLATGIPFLMGIPAGWDRFAEFQGRLADMTPFRGWPALQALAASALVAAYGSYRLVCLPVALAGTWVAAWRMPRWGLALAWLAFVPALSMQLYLVGVLHWLRGGATPLRVLLSLVVLWLATGILVFVGYAVGRMIRLALHLPDPASTLEDPA
ncbi:MAG: hypothetical protein VKP72_13935 [bacterium]|nr:hypothetical protein [bacterium]